MGVDFRNVCQWQEFTADTNGGFRFVFEGSYEKRGCKSFWTAGQRTDPETESAFVWKPDAQSTNYETMSYTNWRLSEPNYWRGQREACLQMVYRTYGYRTSKHEAQYAEWNDERCERPFFSICELNAM